MASYRSCRIGVSLASYLPWSAFYPRKAAEWAEEDGFSFLGGLPLRGMRKCNLDALALPIRYLGEAWNPASFWEVMRKRPTEKGLAPKWWDWLFFPNPEKSSQIFKKILDSRNPLLVANSFEEWIKWRDDLGVRGLWEISGELRIDPKEQAFWMQKQGVDIALDLCHIRENPMLRKWQETIPLLLPHTELIHVQPFPQLPPNELTAIMRGEKTELEDMLQLIQSLKYKGLFLIEANIGKKGIFPWKLRRALRQMRELVEKYL